jgi:hypothetical protein
MPLRFDFTENPIKTISRPVYDARNRQLVYCFDRGNAELKKIGYFPFGRMDLVRPKDKYLSMTIDSKTNMPTHIPIKCTSKIDFRCYDHVKEKIKAIADANDTSMTKVILDAINVYWAVLEE